MTAKQFQKKVSGLTNLISSGFFGDSYSFDLDSSANVLVITSSCGRFVNLLFLKIPRSLSFYIDTTFSGNLRLTIFS